MKENRDILEIRNKSVIFRRFVSRKCVIVFAGNLTISYFRYKFNKMVRKGGVNVYEKFAELLDKFNKTAYQVSKDTGIAQSVLSDWKRGISTPKTPKLKILADYFGVSIEYFLE